jgi:hypothetical protein
VWKVDDAVVGWARAGHDVDLERLAYEFVDGPVRLLTSLRAVVNRVAATALQRAIMVAHGAERVVGSPHHGSCRIRAVP